MADEDLQDHPIDPERVAAARAHLEEHPNTEDVAALFRLLGDPVRGRIVSSLGAVEEMCVGDLALAMDVSENAVSYALRHLRAAGLVHRRRAGRVIYYRLADARLAQLVELGRRFTT